MDIDSIITNIWTHNYIESMVWIPVDLNELMYCQTQIDEPIYACYSH